MNSRKLLIPLAAAGALLLAACSGGDSVDIGGSGSGSSGGDQVLVAAIASEPDQLDPHKTSAYASFEVLENVYDTLVEPDENLEMQPALAESWDLSDDQLTWTFHLRDGVSFTDGAALTAEDVAYSYNRIIDDELSPSWRFSAVTSVKATDDKTVVIKVSAPTPNLLTLIGGYKGLAIVEKSNVESGDITRAPVGTGPFSVAEWTSGDHITLKANPDYWGGAPKLSGVEFRFISEGSTALTALSGGEIQWTDSIPVQKVASLQSDDSLELATAPSNDYQYLSLNEEHAPWDDPRARQAVAYAIDRDAIVQAATSGTGVLNQLAIPQESAWYTAYDTYSLDQQKAQDLFDEVGYTGGTVNYLATSDYPETGKIGQILADNLEPYGIKVKIRTVDFATWLDEQGAGKFDAYSLSWIGNLDPDEFYYSQHHTDGSFNFQHYSNPEVDKLLDAARTETDTDTRKQQYADAATQIADDASYIYLYNPAVIQAWAPSVQGYTARSDRAIRFRDVSLSS
ncbi:ABC transporter substrate-binding protein [Nocardioides sp.]|uniref:ABC transporter substrate-binding protein n=1 Tax=Nocardioides sp. TaxID=35761 RepID=UPI00352701AC